MRKNYIHLVLLLLLNISMFGQKVTLTPTLVNGVAYSSGSINLGSLSTSSVSLSVEIVIPTNVSVGDQGTIKIYFSKIVRQDQMLSMVVMEEYYILVVETMLPGALV